MNALRRGGWKARALYKELRLRLLAESSDIQERVMKYWIGYRSRRKNKVFAEIRLCKRKIDVFILPAVDDLLGANGMVYPVPSTNGWGWFRSRFWIQDKSEIDDAVKLIRQSYALA